VPCNRDFRYGGHPYEISADRSQTVIATDHLIAHFKSKGYEFVTIPEMMEKAVLSNQFPVLS
jgi:hypothetical protein